MKRTLLTLSIVVLSIIFRVDVFALDEACTPQEQIRLRQLVGATKITYEFYENELEQTYGFMIHISGFSPDFYVYNETNGAYFEYKNNPVVTSGGFADGITYELPFFASDTGVCKGYLISTKMVALPRYNPYSKSTLCVGHESYELCKKFTPAIISTSREFEQRMNQYIKSLEKKEKEEPKQEKPEQESTIWKVIGDFFINYYMVFLLSIIILGTTGIIFIEVKKRRSIL